MGVGTQRVLIGVLIVEHHDGAVRVLVQQEHFLEQWSSTVPHTMSSIRFHVFERNEQMARMVQLFCCLLSV